MPSQPAMHSTAPRTYLRMDAFDEAAAWRAAKAGDGNAFGELFDAHTARVYRHALRMTGGVHDAQDVAAAAFLELWRSRDRVRVVDDSVLPWLLATTTNLALNQGRGLRRHQAFLSRLPRQELLADSAEAEALAVVGSGLSPRLRREIRALSATDQRLLALVGLEDYTLRAAAQALDITEQAARSRWQRIRRRLAEQPHPNSLALAAEH